MTAETEASGRSSPGGAGAAAGDPAPAGVGRRFGSLTSRIITAVCAAVLVTSFAVAYTATQATEAFLRDKIDERLPVILERTATRLEDWYTQRELDIETFARSETVADCIGPAAEADRLAREEARKYLAYVREGFPQYDSLFLLDGEGDVQVWVGREPGLSESLLDRLARSHGTGNGTFYRLGDGHYQFISVSVARAGQSIGSLHAMIAVESIEALLRGEEDLEADTRIFVVGEDGRIVAHSNGPRWRTAHDRPAPVPSGGGPRVEDYTTASGEHVVGTALALQRFGWNLTVEESYEAAFAPIVSVRQRIVAINLSIVLGCVLLAYLLARSITRPIHALSQGARRIADGDTDVVLPAARGHDEIAVLSAAFSEMIARQRKANEDLRRTNEMLEQLSLTDDLTRLHNHRYFQDRLQVETRRAHRSGDALALLLLDIDDFKALNDRHGHAAGDEVLRQVALVLNESVREIDLPARYGGEEFAVLAPRTDVEGAITLAEKLRTAIGEAEYRLEGVEGEQTVRVTVSIGVAHYDGDEKGFFNAADRALYRAKAAGKDCVVFDEPVGPGA